MTARLGPMLLTASALFAIHLGCQATLDLPEPLTAYRWCLDAEPAQGVRGGHEGFVLVEVGPESFPAALGLRAGDVLWQVNGLPLRDLGDVMRAFEVLDQVTAFTVKLDRRAQTLTRTYRRVARLGEP